MPVLDRREPAVYVTIEDHSYAAPTLEVGRVPYIVTVCDRGPQNQIVTVTSREQFYKLFGPPNYRRTALAHYLIDKCLQYTSKVLVVRAMTTDSHYANRYLQLSSTPHPIMVNLSTYALGTFIHEKAYVVCDNQDSYNAVTVGKWICAAGDNGSDEYLAEVVEKYESKTIENNTYSWVLILDRLYAGTDERANIAIYYMDPVIDASGSIDSDFSINPDIESKVDVTDSSFLWYFIARGVGTYCNTLEIKGTRNVTMEKMFTNDDGEVLFKYLFMDIAVYRVNEDNTRTLMEGPWTVSLTRRTSYGQTVRDLSSGTVLYIEDVINENSQFIQAVSCAGVSKLVADNTTGNMETDAARRRQQVVEYLSASGAYINEEGSVANGGIELAAGTDGVVGSSGGVDLPMYNTSGDLTSLYDATILAGVVAQAYNGGLPSIDGSISQIPECTYPWKISGAYVSDNIMKNLLNCWNTLRA